MFSQSRRRIILSIMGSLILLFVITLAVITAASVSEVRQRNRDMLERFAETYDPDDDMEEPEPPDMGQGQRPERREPPIDERPDFRLSTFYAVSVSDDGHILSADTGGRDIYSRDELISIAKEVLAGGKQSGNVDNLTYVIDRRDDYTLVAFIDNTVSEGGLHTLLRYMLIVGSISIVVLFFVALWISKRIIGPLEENDRQQKRFISDASHELKTPVAVIGTNAELLSREIGDNEWLANIQYENDRMGGLVKQLLDLSRAENAEVSMEQTDFSRLVTGEALAFEGFAFDKGKTLRTDIEEGIILTGNRQQLTQLVSVLLDNAVRHSNGSEILFELKHSNRAAVLRAVNDGDEIPREKLEHLFDRFYQTDEARSGEGQHYGLGLSIAKAIAEKHGGSIEVSCRDGKIIFTVTLPVKK